MISLLAKQIHFPTNNGMTVCSYYVTYLFQSESTLYSSLNVKELLARNRREIWSLSDCSWTRSHNHWIRKRKRTLNHLAKLAKVLRLWTKRLCVRVQLQSLKQWYEMTLDLMESKIYNPLASKTTKTKPKHLIKLHFVNKSMGMINISKIINDKNVKKNLSTQFHKTEQISTVYTLTKI